MQSKTAGLLSETGGSVFLSDLPAFGLLEVEGPVGDFRF
jgi:hypothetical protein